MADDSTDDRVDPTGEFSGDKSTATSTTDPAPEDARKEDAIGDTATGDKDKDAEYTKQLQNQYETDIKRSEEHAHNQQQFIDNIQKQQADLANTPKPQLQQMPPAGQEQKGQVTQRVLQVLAIAGVAFSLFGRRRNGYAQGALMGGIGALINGYIKGQQEQHNQNTKNWHQLNESVHTENQQRLNDYKEILANKKLSLQQQMELMRMKGQFYQSDRMERNAAAGDLAKIHKHVTDMEKWQQTHRANTIMAKGDQENWRALVLEKSGGKADINTPEGLKWAFDNYPPSAYFNDKKTPAQVADPTDPNSKKKGPYTGKKEEKEPQTELDRRMDEKFGKIKPQASPSPTPSGDKKPSVMEKDTSEFAAPNESDDGTGL